MEVKKAIKYKTRCHKCGSKLEFGFGEIEFHDNPFDRGGFIECPVCGEVIETHTQDYADYKYRLLHYIEPIYEEEENQK